MALRYEGDQKDWALIAGDSRVIFSPKESRGDWLLFFFCIPIQLTSVLICALAATADRNPLAEVGVTIAPAVTLAIGIFVAYASVRVTCLQKIRRRIEIMRDESNAIIAVVDQKKIASSKTARLVDLTTPGGNRCAILVLDTGAILVWLEWRHGGSSGQPNRRYKKFEVKNETRTAPTSSITLGDDGPFYALSEACAHSLGLDPTVRAMVDDDVPLSQFYRSPAMVRFPISVSLGAGLAYGFYRSMDFFVASVWTLSGALRFGAGVGAALAMLALEVFVFGMWLRIGFGRAIDRRIEQLRRAVD